MGNVWDKSIVKKEEVQKNIEEANELVQKDPIMDFIGLYLDFSINEELPGKKIIKANIRKYSSQEGIDNRKGETRLTIEQFYSFYNALMNSMDYFYEKKLLKGKKTLTDENFDKIGPEESNTCPICEEDKVEVRLPCSHFFCEDCIKSWVIKSETCPLCRLKLKYNEKNKKKGDATGIEGSQRWDIINNDDEFKEQMKQENKDLFLKITKDLFYNKSMVA